MEAASWAGIRKASYDHYFRERSALYKKIGPFNLPFETPLT
jgi:hypothetical protein